MRLGRLLDYEASERGKIIYIKLNMGIHDCMLRMSNLQYVFLGDHAVLEALAHLDY